MRKENYTTKALGSRSRSYQHSQLSGFKLVSLHLRVKERLINVQSLQPGCIWGLICYCRLEMPFDAHPPEAFVWLWSPRPLAATSRPCLHSYRPHWLFMLKGNHFLWWVIQWKEWSIRIPKSISRNSTPTFWMCDIVMESMAQTPGTGEDAGASLRAPRQACLFILQERTHCTLHQSPSGPKQVCLPSGSSPLSVIICVTNL